MRVCRQQPDSELTSGLIQLAELPALTRTLRQQWCGPNTLLERRLNNFGGTNAITFGQVASLLTRIPPVIGYAPSQYTMRIEQLLELRWLQQLPELYVEGPPAGVGEGGNMIFRISLERASGTAVNFDVNTRDYDAVAGTDYVAVHERRTFAVGQTVMYVTVPTIDDTVIEGVNDECIGLRASNSDGTHGGTAGALGCIIDNDRPTLDRLGVRDAVQQAIAALESDIEEALHDGCHVKWIAAITGANFRVIQRIRDEGSARSWRHPQRRGPAPRRNHCPDMLPNEGDEDFTVTICNPTG